MSLTAPTVEARPAPWRPLTPLPDGYETDRLLLRAWRHEDAAGMLAAIDVDRESLLPWLPWPAVDNRTLYECIFQIERFRRDGERTDPPADNFVIAIIDRRGGEVLGGTGLHRVNHALHQAEIGYWLRADRRRQGICTEAVAGLLTWAFTPQSRGGWGLRRIEIFCAGGNTASQRVPQKLGLRQEVHRRADRWVPGIGWDDTLGWGVLAEEWAQILRRRP